MQQQKNEIYFSGAIGDTLGITAILPQLYEKYGRISLYTHFPDLFYNNEYVSSTQLLSGHKPNLMPCTVYECNIIKHYCEQLGLKYTPDMKPKVYLTDDEIAWAKGLLSPYKPYKKIAVCLNSSADSKDLRYDYVRNMLDRLKKEFNVKLFLFGTVSIRDTADIFDQQFIGRYAQGLRGVFALISLCDMYVGVDTGLFHAAASLNIPQAAFFRSNGCANNVYDNTITYTSTIGCPVKCRMPYLGTCTAVHRCLDGHNLNDYYNSIVKQLCPEMLAI